MPPRKKIRVHPAASPDPEPFETSGTTGKSPALAVATTPPSKPVDSTVLDDPWTDEEEVGLFKGLMRWKPTGIHKHFRLLALHAWLLDNNYIHPRNEHTRPAGIWQKLNQLYDLSALDAREDARQLSPLQITPREEDSDHREESDDADVYSMAANKIENATFELPPEVGFEEMMWKRRLPDKPEDDTTSEPEIPDLNQAEDPPIRFTPSFSIEPSEAATPSARAPRGRRRKSGRGAPTNATRRSARKTESVADKEDNEEESENQDPDGEEGEEDEEIEDSEDQKSQASASGPRRGRSQKNTRGRGSGRGRGRGRGRGK